MKAEPEKMKAAQEETWKQDKVIRKQYSKCKLKVGLKTRKYYIKAKQEMNKEIEAGRGEMEAKQEDMKAAQEGTWKQDKIIWRHYRMKREKKWKQDEGKRKQHKKILSVN